MPDKVTFEFSIPYMPDKGGVRVAPSAQTTAERSRTVGSLIIERVNNSLK
jgi:hypothetical protein